MGLTKPRAAQIYNLDYKQATRVVTVTNITLSAGAPSTVDGVSLSLNDRVLVTAQSTGSQNGLYKVTTVGSGSNGTWVRSSDGNDTGEIEAGMVVMVTEGTIYHDTQWKLTTDDPIVIGTTVLTFTQNYSANSISGGTSNVTVLTNANVTISSAGTANVLVISSTGTIVTGTESVTGNITAGNVLTGGLISATGNITGNYFLGNVFYANGITASKIYSGNSEVNVTASGGNVNVSIGGTSNVAVFTTAGEYVTGLVSASGNITGGNVLTGGLISATGNATAGNVLTGGLISATANITAGNILTLGLMSATGNITGSFVFGNGYYLTGVSGGGGGGIKWTTSNTAPSSPIAGDFWYNGNTSVKYQYTNDGTANYWVDQSFPTSFSTLAVTTAATVGTTLNVTGNTTSGNLLTGGLISAAGNINGTNIIGIINTNSIINSGSNGTGNIGSSTATFNTIFAKATSAQYADLAEMYSADQNYEPGTVVDFGGDQEITITSLSHSVCVAGVISTNPSYLMNATQTGEYVLPVALTGRIPCRVVGTISKGDLLVASNILGVAGIMDIAQYRPGCIIGKALESYNSDVEGQIEIAVGRY